MSDTRYQTGLTDAVDQLEQAAGVAVRHNRRAKSLQDDDPLIVLAAESRI